MPKDDWGNLRRRDFGRKAAASGQCFHCSQGHKKPRHKPKSSKAKKDRLIFGVPIRTVGEIKQGLGEWRPFMTTKWNWFKHMRSTDQGTCTFEKTGCLLRVASAVVARKSAKANARGAIQSPGRGGRTVRAHASSS